jgi:ribonuclease HI
MASFDTSLTLLAAQVWFPQHFLTVEPLGLSAGSASLRFVAHGSAVEIYTDGACLGNPGPGGFAVVMRSGTGAGGFRAWTGADAWTTNNRMELTAAAVALEELSPSTTVVVHTDSTYVATGFTSWLPRWKRNGWRSRDGSVANKDLWQKLAEAAARHDAVEFKYVRGHNGHRWNELADELACEEARAIRDGLRSCDALRVISSDSAEDETPDVGLPVLTPMTLF